LHSRKHGIPATTTTTTTAPVEPPAAILDIVPFRPAADNLPPATHDGLGGDRCVVFGLVEDFYEKSVSLLASL
jgi:hypothetical protein